MATVIHVDAVRHRLSVRLDAVEPGVVQGVTIQPSPVAFLLIIAQTKPCVRTKSENNVVFLNEIKLLLNSRNLKNH